MDKLKSKIQKVLHLSQSPNPNEAKAALEKARQLMKEAGISEFELKEYGRESVKATKRYSQYRTVIANSVAALYGVQAVAGGSFWHFYGEKLHTFLAMEMYGYIVKSIDRSAKENVRKNAKARYRDHYRVSMARTIAIRLAALGQRVSWAPELPARKELSRQFAEKELGQLKTHSHKGIRLGSAAQDRGRDAGQKLSLHRQTTGSGGRYLEE